MLAIPKRPTKTSLKCFKKPRRKTSPKRPFAGGLVNGTLCVPLADGTGEEFHGAGREVFFWFLLVWWFFYGFTLGSTVFFLRFRVFLLFGWFFNGLFSVLLGFIGFFGVAISSIFGLTKCTFWEWFFIFSRVSGRQIRAFVQKQMSCVFFSKTNRRFFVLGALFYQGSSE